MHSKVRQEHPRRNRRLEAFVIVFHFLFQILPRLAVNEVKAVKHVFSRVHGLTGNARSS